MQKIKIGAWDVIRSSGSFHIKAIKLIDLFWGTLLSFILPAKKEGAVAAAATRLLIIRPGGIGDAIFLLPLLRSIRANNPPIRIDILCERRNAGVFLSQSQLNFRVYRYDTAGEFFSLFKNEYDVIIDSEQWHYLSAITAYFLRAKTRIGFATRPLRAKLFNRRIPYEINGYELDNFKKLFEGLKGAEQAASDINSCFEVPAQAASWAAKRINSKSVTVFLGASIPERRLTHEQSLKLIHGLLERKLSIILLGGEDVRETSACLEKEAHSEHITNLVGKTSLEQSAALIRESRLFIGADSGLMHLACAVGTPAIAIFGPGNLKKWGPKGEKHSIITENAECSPCTVFGYTLPTCKGSYHCMRNIPIENILNNVNIKG